MVTSYWCGV